MPERDEKKPSERPDALTDFTEEFEQHPDAPSRDQARRARSTANNQPRDPIVPRSEAKPSGEVHQAGRSEAKPSGEVHQDALARIEAIERRVRDFAKK